MNDPIVPGMIHVLMVDDQISLLKSLAWRLGKEGYRVSSVASGAAALELVVKDPPDVVFMDIEMPEMDGYAVVREMRQLRATAAVPIVFLSGRGGVLDKVTGLDVGADDYITKPVEFLELVARLESSLAKNRRVAGAHPRSGLPGAGVVETEVRRRLAAGEEFVLAFADIADFGLFNEKAGYAKGDQLLTALGGILRRSVQQFGSPYDLVGHVAGDDFVIAASPGTYEGIARNASEALRRLADVALTFGAVDSSQRRLDSYGEAAGAAADALKEAKAAGRARLLGHKKVD